MKKMIRFLLPVLAVLLIFAVRSAVLVNSSVEPVMESPEYAYRILEDGSAEITKYLGIADSGLVIPQVLDGHKVTAIGYRAFPAATRLRSRSRRASHPSVRRLFLIVT